MKKIGRSDIIGQRGMARQLPLGHRQGSHGFDVTEPDAGDAALGHERGRAHGVYWLHKALVCQNADDDARFGFRFRRLRAGDSGVRRRLRGQDEPDR